jgi:7-cyano-7-deazaguanine synthase
MSLKGTQMEHNKIRALVVLSGGQDSTTCLAWAIAQGWDVHAITFDYGQRHKVEILAAMKIADMAGIGHKHEVISIGEGILAGDSPLTNKSVKLEQYTNHQSLPGGLEKTFVPLRNQLFMTIAANRAYILDCHYIITGVCQEDSGGYPDCRRVFINALQDAINYGSFTGEPSSRLPLEILTPLMSQTKAESVVWATCIKGCYKLLAYSHTSYDGMYPPVGHDHATLLRQKGFEEAGIPDPLVLRAHSEGLMSLPATSNYLPDLLEIYNPKWKN